MNKPVRDKRISVSCPQHSAGRADISVPGIGHNRPPADKSVPDVNRVALQDVARERFADLLRAAFPARTDAETARQAGAWLGYDPKTVLRWLARENGAPFEVAFAIGCRVGVFAVMDVMTRGEGRSAVLSRIVQGVRRVTGR